MRNRLAEDIVVVAGQGYVGLPLAMAAVASGKKVVGIDTDARRVEKIASGSSPVSGVASEEIAAALSSGIYEVHSDYSSLTRFKTAIITVPTPLEKGSPNLQYIEASAESLASKIAVGSTIILESTTYPGTTEDLVVPILESISGLRAGLDFLVGYSPERIDPGNADWNITNTPKVTSGVNHESAIAVAAFYSDLGIPVVPVSGTKEAELTKLLENTFRHVNIALVNELAMFSHQLDVNIWEAIDAASTKPFGFMKFSPGPGVGGHCLPIDPSYLSWAIRQKAGANFRFVELANVVNAFMPSFVVEKIENLMVSRGKTLVGLNILIGGLAYKPATGDVRESPGLAVAEILLSRGAIVTALDDLVSNGDWPSQVAKHDPKRQPYDIAVAITIHDEKMAAALLQCSEVVLDTRGVLESKNVHRL